MRNIKLLNIDAPSSHVATASKYLRIVVNFTSTVISSMEIAINIKSEKAMLRAATLVISVSSVDS